MPRNGSGTFTLVTGNPVVSGTIIESTWANSTLADIADSITNSLARNGEGGMTAPLRLIDGVAATPSLAFANETGSGLYRAAAGDVGLTVLGSRILRLQAAGASVTGTLGVSGATTLSSTLGVTGVATLTANPVLSAGTANGIPYLNGSKSLTSGSSLVFDGSKLGIGTASPYSTLDVGTTGSQVLTSLFTTGVDDLSFRIGAINGVAGSTGSLQGQLGLFYLGSGEAATIGFVRGGGANDGSLTFRTNGNERTRIDSSGNLLVGKTDPVRTVTGAVLRADGALVATSSNDAGEFYRKTSSGGAGVILTFSDVGGANTLVGIGYANGTFGAVSDVNKKKNIQEARSYLDDVMKLRVVKYNWITDDENSSKDLGWIAQEVQEVFPGMVSEIEGSLLLKKEVFLPMLMKCIQELKVEVDALKAVSAA